jgi:hypothetical protein
MSGRDFVNSFQVVEKPASSSGSSVGDPDILIAGTTNARKGVVEDSDTDLAVVNPRYDWQDETRDVGQYSNVYDGMLFALRDQKHSAEQQDGESAAPTTDQKLWSTYLSPTVPTGQDPTDDLDEQLESNVFPRIQRVDFVWSAKAAGTGDKLVFMLASVRSEINEGTEIGPRSAAAPKLVTVNLTQLQAAKNPAAAGNAWRDWVSVQDFAYGDVAGALWADKRVVNDAPRSIVSGQSGPSLFARYADSIVKFDLPKDGEVVFDTRGMVPTVAVGSGAWGRTNFLMQDADIRPQTWTVSPNGQRLYVACEVTGYQSDWRFIPPPRIGEQLGVNGKPVYSGGKTRSGASDIMVIEYEVKTGSPNWTMLQGGDSADAPTAIAALSDGTLMVAGTTLSRPTAANPNGWIPRDDSNLLGAARLAPVPKSENLLRVDPSDMSSTNFLMAIKTNNRTPSKSEIDIRGGGDLLQPIVSGDVTPVVLDGTDFGKSAFGQLGAERTFRIRNVGSEALVVSAAPTIPAAFELTFGTFPQSIAPGTSYDFKVRARTATIGAAQGSIIISSNDSDEDAYSFAVKAEVIAPPPSTFSVAATAASVLEGNSGTKAVSFTVTLTPGIPAPVYPLTVQYAIVGVTATAGTDFTGGSGTLTFASASDLVKTVTATVRGDTLAEQNETFKLVLSSPSSGVVSAEAGEAVVTITNDDGTPKPLSVGFAPATYRVPEGAAGTTTRVPLTIQLTEAQATAVVVNYATSNGTASAGSDYTAKSGTVTIPAGQTQGTFNVVVTGDSTGESDETFTVRLTSATSGVLLNPAAATVTIVNDDGAAPLPTVRVSTASVTEGNTGSPKMTFTITLAKAMTTATVLTYATLDGTAKAGSHYVAATGTVTIPAGRTSATVTVTVRPNRIVDGNRTLSLQVRSGSTLVATGVGTIIDDDKAAVRAAFAAFAAEPVSTGVTKKK